eukprot:1188313-Prorocentrum_minimum.AAC.2
MELMELEPPPLLEPPPARAHGGITGVAAAGSGNLPSRFSRSARKYFVAPFALLLCERQHKVNIDSIAAKVLVESLDKFYSHLLGRLPELTPQVCKDCGMNVCEAVEDLESLTLGKVVRNLSLQAL